MAVFRFTFKKILKNKTQVNVYNCVIELLGIMYGNKHLKTCIEIKACGNASHPLVTSAEFIVM